MPSCSVVHPCWVATCSSVRQDTWHTFNTTLAGIAVAHSARACHGRTGPSVRPRACGCDHYHAVFTLPHELLALWEWNRAAMARTLFASAHDTLMTLLADPRFLDATPGIVMALHTWGRTLNHHPHVHALVSGGG